MLLGHHFQGQGHQAALLSAALTRKAAAAVSVRMYSAWESTATFCLLGGARSAWAPTEGGSRAGGILCVHSKVGMCSVLVVLVKFSILYLPSDWLETSLRKLNRVDGIISTKATPEYL